MPLKSKWSDSEENKDIQGQNKDKENLSEVEDWERDLEKWKELDKSFKS